MTPRVKSPLRYPGGKAKLAPVAKRLIELNRLGDGTYVEPYAGGAGLAVELLLTEYVRRVVLNDISYPLYCFWKAVVDAPDYLCRRIRDVAVTPSTWLRLRATLKKAADLAPEEVGFAFFFLNRTSRSGIVSGGIIGGYAQDGEWSIDARFNRAELVRRIEAVTEYGHRISVHCMDAEEFIGEIANRLDGKCMVYFDPPYYSAGRRLYPDTYCHDDHVRIARTIQDDTAHPWFATYDSHPVIRSLYSERRQRPYALRYSACLAQTGQEVMIFSDSLKVPRELFDRYPGRAS